jgi:hypothetical protein
MAIQDDLAKADKSKSKKQQLDPMYSRKAPVAKKSVAKPVDKSGYNKNIKVSQTQIDAVKKLGMSGAIKGASAMSPAMREAAVRLYGAKRIGATRSSKPAVASGNSSNYGNGAGKPAMVKKGTPKTGPGKAPYSTMSNKRVANPNKLSIGEQITAAFTGKVTNPKNKLGSKPASTGPKVKQESARDRLLRETMAKKKK